MGLSFSPVESNLCQAGVMVKRTLDVSSTGAESLASLLLAVAASLCCVASSSSAFSSLSPGSSTVDMLFLASTVDGGSGKQEANFSALGETRFMWIVLVLEGVVGVCGRIREEGLEETVVSILLCSFSCLVSCSSSC